MEENENEEKIKQKPIQDQPIQESTIGGLINRLKELNYIKTSKEELTFKDSLKQATKKFENADQTSKFLLGLSEEISISHGEIFNESGINVEFLKKIVEHVTKVVELDTQAQVVTQETPDLTDNDKTDSELQAKIEEMAQEYYDNMDNVFAEMGLQDFNIDEEEKKEIAENVAKVRLYLDSYEKAINEGKSREEAKQIAYTVSGITEEELNSSEFGEAKVLVNREDVKKICQQKECPESEAVEELSRRGRVVLSEEGNEQLKAGKSFDEVSGNEFKKANRKKHEDRVNRLTEQINKCSGQQAIYEGDGADIDIEKLIGIIKERDEASKKLFEEKRKLRELDGIKIEDKYKVVLEEAAKRYASIDELSIHDIFEELKVDQRAEGLEFEDIFNYIYKDAEENLTRSEIGGASQLMLLEKKEREIRQISQILESYYMSINGTEKTNTLQVRAFNKRKVMELEKKFEKLKQDSISIKGQLRKSKDVDKVEFVGESIKDRAVRKKSERTEKSKITLANAIKDKNRIANDRREIIKLAKEEKISMSKATQKYFEANPEKMEQYSSSEKSILLKVQDGDSKKNKGASNFFKKLLKSKNNQVITSSQQELDGYEGIIDDATKSDMEDTRLSQALKKAEKRREVIAKARKNNERIDKKIDAESLLKQKEKDALSKIAFRKYIESGKTINQVLEEMNKDGGGNVIDRYDVLNEIQISGAKCIYQTEIEDIFSVERKNCNLELEIKALEILQRNAAEKGNTKLENEHKKKIEDLRGKIEINQKKLEEIRKKAIKVMGLEQRDGSQQNEAVINENEVEDERKTSSIDTITSEEHSPEPVMNEIKIENMAVEDENSNKQIVDAEKVAKKGKIRGLDLKKAVSGIKQLKIFRDKSAEQTTDDKVTPAVQETGDEEISQ